METRIFSRNPRKPEEPLEEAAEWLVALRETGDEATQAAAWLEWSRKDPGNLKAFERVMGLADGLRALDPERKSALLLESLGGEVATPYRPRGGSVRRVAWALAASLLVGIIVAASWTWSTWYPGRGHTAYTTGVSQDRAVRLPDGSGITLSASSRVQVAYGPRQRLVRLIAGEAYFRVRHDATRPFIVEAGALRIEDLGTAFDVNVNGSHVVVAVAAGEVSAGYASGPASGLGIPPVAPPVKLIAGEQLDADGASAKLAVSTVQPDGIAPWRRGRLHFRDAPLSEVVTAIDRYAKRPIVLGDPQVAGMRFTGTVLLTHIDDWLTATREVFPIREQRLPDGRVVLTTKPRD